jgi:hypothetical protein
MEVTSIAVARLANHGIRGKGVKIRTAQFTFRQLAEFRSALIPRLKGLNGVTAWDVDETANELRVEVIRADAVGTVEQAAKKVGIPDAALRVALVEPDVPATLAGAHVSTPASNSCPVPSLFLHNCIRPLMGGLQVNDYHLVNSVESTCTMGFIFQRPWGSYTLVSNSHCTGTRGTVEGDPIFNAETGGYSYWSSPYEIGHEVEDPSGSSCYLGMFACRHADVALFDLTTTDSIAFGRIARTENQAWGWGVSGSLLLDSLQNSFEIVDNGWIPLAQTPIEKVGRSTGWTHGVVKNSGTCVSSQDAGGWIYTCQYRISTFSNFGDSGSPVFYWYGDNTIGLMGVLHAFNSDEHYSVFSPMENIAADLSTQIYATR